MDEVIVVDKIATLITGSPSLLHPFQSFTSGNHRDTVNTKSSKKMLRQPQLRRPCIIGVTGVLPGCIRAGLRIPDYSYQTLDSGSDERFESQQTMQTVATLEREQGSAG